MTDRAIFEVHAVRNEQEWEQVRSIRERVFIQEQECPPEEEWDEYDETSRHLIGTVDGSPAAAARWRTVAVGETIVAKLERFAVLPGYRGFGYGKNLVLATLADARQAGFTRFLIHAQAHLELFYEHLGFRVQDRTLFYEAGIPHLTMISNQ